ncbi:HNH endonuclease [Devosia honganensis]|uniref:HNH endonuclease n=1 Tax=Devosia honganensis TaxID=1610527 RepID=A0ABV7X587_9HYPH
MARSPALWIGKTDDQAIPPRVRLRVFERAGGRCQCCGRKLGPGDKWQADHVIALINGGAHSEANLQCLCDWCHKAKTREDVAEKAKSARIRQRQAGIRPAPKFQSRGFPKAQPQKTASRPTTKGVGLAFFQEPEQQ